MVTYDVFVSKVEEALPPKVLENYRRYGGANDELAKEYLIFGYNSYLSGEKYGDTLESDVKQTANALCWDF